MAHRPQFPWPVEARLGRRSPAIHFPFREHLISKSVCNLSASISYADYQFGGTGVSDCSRPSRVISTATVLQVTQPSLAGIGRYQANKASPTGVVLPPATFAPVDRANRKENERTQEHPVPGCDWLGTNQTQVVPW